MLACGRSHDYASRATTPCYLKVKHWERASPIPPRVFAEKILPRIRRNHPVIVEPFMWRVIARRAASI